MKDLIRFKPVFCFISILPILAKNGDKVKPTKRPSLHKKCLYSEFFWTVFSRIRFCGDSKGFMKTFKAFIKPFEAPQRRMRKNVDQKNSEYRNFQALIIFKEINVSNKPYKKH